MHDFLHRTGPYLHAPDDVSRLSFETGGTPRVFTLLVASAVETDRIDLNAGGLAILDEDEGCVVLDRHMGQDPAKCGDEFYRIRSLGWADFSGFCRSHARFRGQSADIRDQLDQPLPGSRRRQSTRADGGPISLEARSGDLRSDRMIHAAQTADHALFPRTNRMQAIEDLSDAQLTRAAHGLHVMSWTLRFPDMLDTGGLQGKHPVDRALDPAWSEVLRQRPELIEEARLDAITSLLSGPGDEGDHGRFGLIFSADGQGSVQLVSFDEDKIAVIDARALRTLLDGMSDRQIRDLWKLKRTLDQETGPERLEALFGASLNRIRCETETERDPEPQPFGP